MTAKHTTIQYNHLIIDIVTVKTALSLFSATNFPYSRLYSFPLCLHLRPSTQAVCDFPSCILTLRKPHRQPLCQAPVQLSHLQGSSPRLVIFLMCRSFDHLPPIKTMPMTAFRLSCLRCSFHSCSRKIFCCHFSCATRSTPDSRINCPGEWVSKSVASSC